MESQMGFGFFSFLLILFHLRLPCTAQTFNNVTLGSSLQADSRNLSWKSPSGDFAFGFRRISPGGGYLLAIWFDKIPEKTILWSANRDNPAEQGSTIQLFENGRFSLDGPRDQRIWQANHPLLPGEVAYGALLDTGNFVLARNNSVVGWQTFDEPTDTLLPTQTMIRGGRRLVSSISETNFSSGRFVLTLQSDGIMQLETRNPLIESTSLTYWTVGENGERFVFNQSGYIFLEANNGTALAFVSSNGASDDQYQRAVLEYDGLFVHYVYPKFSNSTNGRSMRWTPLIASPSNICSRFGGYTSSGACGFNSYCSLGEDQRPVCHCPLGYSPVDSNIRMSGCKPDFLRHNCDRQSEEAGLFTLFDILNTDFPGADYFGYHSMEEDACRQACLDDCLCSAVVYEHRNCWKKRFPMSNGQVNPDYPGKTMIKIRGDNATIQLPNPNDLGRSTNDSNRSSLIIPLSVLLGISVLLLAITWVSLLTIWKKPKTVSPKSIYSQVNVRTFRFKELQEATHGFKDVIGRGAYSTVYRGVLTDESNRLIAVKKLDNIAAGVEQEFESEVSAISQTNHKNLVRLIGYCVEEENRLLVYEYMSTGSLASFLFQTPKPSWYRRVQIALATARGLCYLHEDCSFQIIHCDIKPQNVLLDESLTAKISDFGLAKLLNPDQTRTNTGIRGTRGYVAPEWFRNLPITCKVDVYSFGILLLELVCGRRHLEMEAESENEAILADWAYDCYQEGRLESLASKDEEAMGDIKRFNKFVMIGIWCIQDDPAMRPNMKRVLHMLEGAVEVPYPPNPESFIA